jgi:AhpD family alkylhydroperoxidase
MACNLLDRSVVIVKKGGLIMTVTASEHGLRLAPLDRPRGLLLRLFNWLMRWRLGKEMMPARVIYARFPTLLWRSLPMYHLMERGLRIERALRHLIEVRVSELNGCTFCTDLHRANAGLSRDAPALAADARQRAALRYVEEIARGGVSDEGFEELRRHFNEREIVELTWLQAFTTYLNRMAVPLGIGSDGFCEIQARRQLAAGRAA